MTEAPSIDPWEFDEPVMPAREPPPYPTPDRSRPFEVDMLYHTSRRLLFRIQRQSLEYPRSRDWVVEAWDVPGRTPWVRVYTLVEKGGVVIVGKWRGVHAQDTLLVSNMLREAAARIANVEWYEQGRLA